jgi:hypothetical protein
MTKSHNSISTEEQDLLILWATSAANCWLIMSVGAALAGLAQLIHLA